MSKEIALTNKEEAFIEHLFETGGKIKLAAELAGYKHAETYGYVLRKRLAKEIAEAAQHYLSFNAPRAAKKIVDTMDEDNPNPIQFAAAKDILDRAGAKPKPEEVAQVSVKANIFILPEKKLISDNVIDLEPV